MRNVAPPTLTRTTFETSRALEFFSNRELTMQIGFGPQHWPIALTKELIDNALDACETASVAPSIQVTLDGHSLTVADNGPGVPMATITPSLDYMVRVSDKAYYVSPSRGQLGNALKCVWAAPYVMSQGVAGRVDVETGGIRYAIGVSLDQLAQQPRLTMTQHKSAKVKTGTLMTIHWPEEASYLWSSWDISFSHPRSLLGGYALFNPHASFRYAAGSGDACLDVPVRDPAWAKWVPSWPTSPHWYTPDRFQHLLAAYLCADRKYGRVRTVREVIAEFQGLSGSTARQKVAMDAGLHRATLADLMRGDALDTAIVGQLLKARQERSRPVNPKALGVLGKDHIVHALTSQYGVDADTIEYGQRTGYTAEGLPYVLELACGWSYADDARGARLCGYNFSPCLSRTPFPTLDACCNDAKIDYDAPVTLLVHLACPRLDATDRGKSAVALPSEVREAMQEGMEKVTKPWKALKKKEEKEGRAAFRAMEARRKQWRKLTAKEAAWDVMEAAYLKASAHGRLPANARQIMYAARPDIIRLTGNATPWKSSAYFTQQLLPDFISGHPDLTATWDVVFDARGHFREPHTGREIGLGTVEVRRYVSQWQAHLAPLPMQYARLAHGIRTCGPSQRFRYALFVEKEGFDPLLRQARIEERYDLALMSTKGMTVTASDRVPRGCG